MASLLDSLVSYPDWARGGKSDHTAGRRLRSWEHGRCHRASGQRTVDGGL